MERFIEKLSILSIKILKITLFVGLWLGLAWTVAFAQPSNRINADRAPKGMDTIYYPFYNGQQMIEIDHIGYWDKKIYFLEQSQPRALTHASLHPMPLGNEYFFRDTTGAIVKAYNTKHSLASLTAHFSNIPLNKKGGPLHFAAPYHSSQGNNTGVWYQSPQAMFHFLGHYKVSTGYPDYTNPDFEYRNTVGMEGLKFGLIDSLGSVIIPIQYDEIYPLREKLLVQQNKKWGIIGYQHQGIVPRQYDKFEIDNFVLSAYPEKNDNVFFLTAKDSGRRQAEYVYDAVFLTKTNKLRLLNSYDKLYLESLWSAKDDRTKRYLFVTKNGKKGVLNPAYEEIVPPQYEILDYHGHKLGIFRVAKNGKFGFWDEEFKEKIPLVYEYAEDYGKDGIALVLKNGKYFCIDRQGKKQAVCSKKPTWKVGHTGFPAEKNYASAQTSELFGMVDTVTNRIILPFKYKSFTPIEVSSFFDRNTARLEQMNIEPSHKLDMYDEVLYQRNKIIVKNHNNLYGVIDSSFRVMIDLKYEKLEAVQCHLDLLLYSQNGKPGVMNHSGKDILTPGYDEIRYDLHSEQERDIFQVEKDGKWGIVNFDNEILVPCMYDSIRFLGHWHRPKVKLWVVEKNKKFGVVDEKNETFIPFEYDYYISHLEGHNLWVNDKYKKRYKVIIQQ